MHKRIPVINAGQLSTAIGQRDLDRACREWGVFELVNHGINGDVFEGLLTNMQQFFDLPAAEKLKLERTDDNPWGYFNRELTQNTRDWKEIFDYGPRNGSLHRARLPDQPHTFARALESYYSACETLSYTLLHALAINMGAKPEDLNRHFVSGHSSFARLNYYPPLPPTEQVALRAETLGIHPHTDAGAFTLLLHDDSPGLQVFHHGAWHTVAAERGSIVVNLGDIVQVWSNDRYTAPLHRVSANPIGARYSAPFFFNPSYTTEYHPLPAMVSPSWPARYQKIHWGYFREQRARGDYADHGEEIQISQFRMEGAA